MNVFEVIKNRCSVREYKPDPVPEESLKKILEAARFAPSAHNAQDWKFVVVKDLKKKKKLAEAAHNQEFIAEAPVVIVAVALNPNQLMSCDVPSYAVDLSIACSYMVLQAWELGLGTCWIGAFSQKDIKKIMGIPEKYKVVTLLPFGFPVESPEPKIRKSLEEIVCYEDFND